MSISKIEMQDSNGNALYPHTSGDLIQYNDNMSVIQKIDELQNKLSTLKASLTTAVNNKAGSSLTSDSTIQEITNEVNSIVTLSSGTADANATAANILAGSTAYVKGNKVTGTMTNNGTVTQALNAGGSYTIPAGYHNGSGKVTANSLASQTQATATAGQILSGQTAYVNGNKLTGSMPSLPTVGSGHANATGVEIGTHTAGDSNMYMYLGIPAYTYTADNTWVRYLASNVASKIGLTSDKIISGNNIMGVNGTATVGSMGGIPVYSKILNRSITSSYELIEIPLVENSGKHFVFVTFEGAATRALTCIIDFQSSFNGAVDLYDNTGQTDSYMNIQHNTFTSYKWCLVPNKHKEGIVNLYVI